MSLYNLFNRLFSLIDFHTKQNIVCSITKSSKMSYLILLFLTHVLIQFWVTSGLGFTILKIFTEKYPRDCASLGVCFLLTNSIMQRNDIDLEEKNVIFFCFWKFSMEIQAISLHIK